MNAHEKNVWEEKAARVNEESLAKMERGETTAPAPPPPAPPSVPRTYVPPVKLPDQIWECLWDNCDYMFEDQLDCLDHAVADQKGHVSSWFANQPHKMSEYSSFFAFNAIISPPSPTRVFAAQTASISVSGRIAPGLRKNRRPSRAYIG